MALWRRLLDGIKLNNWMIVSFKNGMQRITLVLTLTASGGSGGRDRPAIIPILFLLGR
jgi:hypothetical protein